MRPVDLSEQLKGAFEQAHQLLVANNEASTPFLRVPNVTVSILSAFHYELLANNDVFASQIFLDELNASTCGGLIKEIIIDKTFEGEVIPESVFLMSRILPIS